MKSAAARSLALFAGIHLLGGHWLALQMVAWIGMFTVNSQEASITEALGKTFGGKHPCAICQAVKAGQEQERDEILIDSANKANAVLLVELALPPLSSAALLYFGEEAIPLTRADATHSPPPWRA